MIQVGSKLYIGRPIGKHLLERVKSAVEATRMPGSPIDVAQATGWHPDDAVRYIVTVMHDHNCREVQASEILTRKD